MRTPILLAGLLVAGPALAQTPAQPSHPSEPPAAAAAISVAFGEVERLTARIVLLDQRLAELDAYAKRCGDKPGCFVKVEPPATDPK